MSRRRRSGSRGGQDRSAASVHSAAPASLRLAVALGEPEREQALLSALGTTGDLVVVKRCLSADELVASIGQVNVDAALVAFDLHRLSESRLQQLTRTRIPLVLLVPDVEDDIWQSFPGVVLPVDAEVNAVQQALLGAIRGERPQRGQRHDDVDAQLAESPAANENRETPLSVIAVSGGTGSPGRTTVALNLAAALGAVAPTVLVDADVYGPTVAAALDADPTRNLSMLVHAEPETQRDWARAIAQEVQPLTSRSPHGHVLCGIPKPEMRRGIPARFFEQIVIELRSRYRYVILDAGAYLLSPDDSTHHIALGLADQILLVATADLIGLWGARTALGLFQVHQIDPERVALIVNCHDRRYHHGRSEIEWALGLSTAAVLPYDHHAVQRALAAQRPLVLDGRSRAGRALLELAERVHGGSVVLPPEETASTRARWRWAPRFGWKRGAGATTDQQGVPDGDCAAHVS